MYWADWGKRNPRIEVANLDGSDRKVFFNISNSTDIEHPFGLTLDYDDDMMYWYVVI